MKKRSLTRQDRLRKAQADVEKTLRQTGYYRSLEKYGQAVSVVRMPDLSFDNKCSPTSDRFFPTTGRRSLPADAKQFPVGQSHKQGPMLIIKTDNLADMAGRKT